MAFTRACRGVGVANRPGWGDLGHPQMPVLGELTCEKARCTGALRAFLICNDAESKFKVSAGSPSPFRWSSFEMKVQRRLALFGVFAWPLGDPLDLSRRRP